MRLVFVRLIPRCIRRVSSKFLAFDGELHYGGPVLLRMGSRMVAGSTAGVHGRSVRESRVDWIQTVLPLGLMLNASPPRLTVGAQNSGPVRWNHQYSRQLPRGNASTVDGCEDERTIE